MGTCGSGRRVGHQLAVLEIPKGAGLFGSIPPASDPDHLVVGRPIGKRVVGSMNDDQPPAIPDIFLQLQAQIRRPVGSVIVPHDRFVLAELRLKVAEVAAKLRGGCDSDLKQSRVLQFLFQCRRSQFPSVIWAAALSINQQYGYRSLGRSRENREKDRAQDGGAQESDPKGGSEALVMVSLLFFLLPGAVPTIRQTCSRRGG